METFIVMVCKGAKDGIQVLTTDTIVDDKKLHSKGNQDVVGTLGMMLHRTSCLKSGG